MRRVIVCLGVVALMLATVGAPAWAGTVTGSPTGIVAGPTYHGTFSEGFGDNAGGGMDGYPAGRYTFTPTGAWNVAIGPNGPQVTGVLRAPACPYQPCFQGWALNLSGGTRWAEIVPSSRVGSREFDSFVDWGIVSFTLKFFVTPSGDGVLVFDPVNGCPHGWTYWELS